jgi:hypothetical protein
MRVRTEIRSLPEAEWSRVVAAMWVMKNTTTEEGRQRYGPAFVAYDYMTAVHAHAALNPIGAPLLPLLIICSSTQHMRSPLCAGDQAHYGPVFAAFHRAWTLQFENSLLAVDPTISGE